MSNKKPKKVLLITAHPDDETLWYTSVVLRNQCDIICVTCGDTQLTRKMRKKEFREATKILGVKNATILGYKDKPRRRLNIEKLEKDLLPIAKKAYKKVYTHSPFGETNLNIHHQDVCHVVHKLFDNVRCTAWNLYPTQTHQLTKEEHILKKYIMGTIYHKEYRSLKETYEISAVEKFTKISNEAAEIFYWAIARFGDRHEMLAKKYRDIWGYKNSPYEIERHAAIEKLIKYSKAKTVLEIGAHEGILTKKISWHSRVYCIEKSKTLASRLRSQGYVVLKKYKSSDFDLVLVASVLEYMKNPEELLRQIDSQFLLIEVIMSDKMLKIANSLEKKYKLIKRIVVLPRWEKMYHNNKKEKMEIYKLGSYVRLFKKA